MSELARAKVNLSLHITGKREDGYHLLDSIVVFPEIGDVLSHEGKGLRISGPFGAGLPTEDNLITKAARLLGRPADIHLVKNLPVASGIGGGSADAAATLRLLAGSNPLPDGLSLGADVPACLVSKPLRMEGIGERLTRLPPLPDYAIVLVNCGAPVSTAAIFSALERVDNPTGAAMPEGLTPTEFFRFIASLRNDMQPTAEQICPRISDVLSALKAQPNCAVARMSGSGGTCFGLFETLAQAEQAAQAIQATEPSWWVAAANG